MILIKCCIISIHKQFIPRHFTHSINIINIYKGVNPCSNMGGIILGRNIHPACGMYCAARLSRGVRGHAPTRKFFKWFNLVRFGVYLDQVLSLKNYYFFYNFFFNYHFFYKKFKNYYFLYKK